MPDIVISLLGVSGLLALMSLLPSLARRLNLPYSVLLAAVGVVLGAVIHTVAAMTSVGPVGDFFHALRGFNLSSEAFLYIFLPVLVFESALAVDVRRLMDDIGPILVMAVVAVLVCAGLVGFALWGVGAAGLVACLLLGAIVATTDPVAVVGIFRDLGAPRRLGVLVEGESLLNDAAAIALFTLLLGMLTAGATAGPGAGPGADLEATLIAFARSFVGGAPVGALAARLAAALMAPLRNLPQAEITLTVALAYLSFIVAEQYVGVSGVVAVVSAALVLGSAGRTHITPDTWDALQHVWRQLGFWASSLIFLLAAMLVPPLMRNIGLAELGQVLVVAFAALVARAVVLYGLIPLLTTLGAADRISHAYKAVMLWGGLRGAVSLALALAVTENPALPPEVKHLVAVVVTGYVLFTLFVNGLTLRPLMRMLGLDRLPAGERAMRNRALALALATIRDDIQALARDDRISAELARDAVEYYARRLVAAEQDLARTEALEAGDHLYGGLVALANREEELYRHDFKEGLIGRRIAEALCAEAIRLRDAAKAGGVAGYRAVAEHALQFGRHDRFALFLHRRLGLQRPLARRLAVRFECLLIRRRVLDELARFNRQRLQALFGASIMATLDEVLAQRRTANEQALRALKLQYPDYAAHLQRRHLGRAALRMEERHYRTLFAESVISQEVLNDLERALARRAQELGRTPRLDLGLKLPDLVARVPLFAGLDDRRRRRIVRLLRPRLALPGERLVRRGDRGSAMYFISSGAVEVYLPGARAPIQLGTGDFFGELALITRQPRTADVRAIGFCQLLVLYERDFRTLIARDPELRAHLHRVAAERMAPDAAAPVAVETDD